MNLRATFSFPLLAKELTERAAHRRTYWMRVLCALLLYLAFWADNRWIFRDGALSPASLLGTGARMFDSLRDMLFIGIYAFVPAMLCGVITQEKERDSLALLLLTELRPWQIVAQKFLGGLVPALSLLLLAMPLGAIAYAYGGFTAHELAYSLLLLGLATLQIAALATWCSCRFRTTTAAFLGTYGIAALLALVPILPIIISDALDKHWISPNASWWVGLHIPIAVLSGFKQKTTTAHIIVTGPLVIAGMTLLFLALAVRDLPRRAFLPARPWLRLFFARIDRFMARTNRIVGSVIFGRKAAPLPDAQPILWREVRTRALARPEHLVRLLLLVEVPTLLATMPLVQETFSRQAFGLSLLAAALGILAVLVLATVATNVFVSERVNQTLDVLLTTPLSAQEIVRQKARALRPLTWVLAVPLLTVFGVEAWFEEVTPWTGYGETLGLRALGENCLQYVTGTVLAVAICLPLVAWLAMWIGLKCRTRLRAIVTTLIVIIAWGVGPFLLIELFDIETGRGRAGRWCVLASPLSYPALNEVGELRDLSQNAWTALVANFAIYGSALGFIRWQCLRKADAYLRR